MIITHIKKWSNQIYQTVVKTFDFNAKRTKFIDRIHSVFIDSNTNMAAMTSFAHSFS